MRKNLVLATAATFGAILMAAHAQDGPQRFADRFARANTTGDGCLTQQQAAAGDLKEVFHDFAQIDAENRGCITLNQIRSFRRQERIQRQQQQQ